MADTLTFIFGHEILICHLESLEEIQENIRRNLDSA